MKRLSSRLSISRHPAVQYGSRRYWLYRRQLFAQTVEELRLTVGKSIVLDYPGDIRQISTSDPGESSMQSP